MKYNYKISIFVALSIVCLSALQLEAGQTTAPILEETQPIPNEQLQHLDLTYVHGGDFILGKFLSEDEIIEQILAYPNLVDLNLTGQLVSANLMSIIQDQLPHLKKLTIKGSIRFHKGDGKLYSWETINPQEISSEMLKSLFFNGSAIETLDLSLSTVDDDGLKEIGQKAYSLKEIYLAGTENITDKGIIFLVENLPNLKLIDLSSYSLREAMHTLTVKKPKISDELIKNLKERGIIIIQNNRTPY